MTCLIICSTNLFSVQRDGITPSLKQKRVKKIGDVHEEKVLGFIPLRLLIIFWSREMRDNSFTKTKETSRMLQEERTCSRGRMTSPCSIEMFGHVFIKLSVERERGHLHENKREMKCVVGKKEPF